MTARWWRVRLSSGHALVASLAVVALVVGLASCSDSGPRSSGGPQPDRMAQAWSVDVAKPESRGGATAAISDAVVAVPDGEDIRLLDPVTGRLRTSLSSIQGGDPVTGVWVSGAIVVVQVGYPIDGPVGLYGFEHTSGRHLWSTRRQLNFTVGVASGAVVLQGDRRWLTVLAADTGKLRWSGEVPDICPRPVPDTSAKRFLMNVAQTGEVLAVLARCSDRAELFGIGLADGSIGWRKPLGQPTDRSCVTADGAVIAVAFDDRFSLFDPDGRTLVERPASGSASCKIRVTDRGVVMVRDPVMELIDPANGRSHWQRKDPDFFLGLPLMVAGRIYVPARTPSNLLPSFVSSTELSGGDSAALPLPLSFSAKLVGAAGDLLIYETPMAGSVRYVAIRPEAARLANPVLAGAAASDWPDACGLLGADELDSLGGFSAFPPERRTHVFGVDLPHPNHCNYLAKDSERAFAVTVSWVGKDVGGLTAMQESQVYGTHGTSERLGSDAFLIPDTGFMEAVAFLHREFYTLYVQAPGDEQLARAVATLLMRSSPDHGKNPTAPLLFDLAASHLVIRSLGYRPDSAPIPPGPLRAITAVCAKSASSHCQQVFFFLEQEFVGVGSGEDAEHGAIYRRVKVSGQDGQTVRVEVGVYQSADPDCCPSTTKPQRYRHEGNVLEYQNDSGPWQPAPKVPK